MLEDTQAKISIRISFTPIRLNLENRDDCSIFLGREIVEVENSISFKKKKWLNLYNIIEEIRMDIANTVNSKYYKKGKREW
jgi:hypothetical protein